MSEEPNNTLDAVKEEIKNTFLSRFNSPFLGAFIVSWLVWNHRLVLVLISGLDVDKRFRYIDETLYPTTTHSLWMNIGGPLVSTLAYIFLLPWVTERVHEWNLGRAQRLRESERKSAGAELLDRDESMAYRRDRQQRLNQIANARNDLEHAQKLTFGWRALAEARKDLSAASGALSDYLRSQEFRVLDPRSPHRGAVGRLRFEEDGEMLVIGTRVAVAAESWFVKDGVLRLNDSEGVEVCAFEYQLSDGAFVGVLEDKSHRMVGEFHS